MITKLRNTKAAILSDFLTCRHDPGPVDEDLAEVVGVPHHAVPAGAQDALAAHGGDGVQVAERRVRRVLK